jgi:predicted Rossmann fold flavoprotein
VRVIVIGGGPAGMMAAGQAARAGADVLLLERNSRLGKKLAITGKGRGNLTNSADMSDFIPQYGAGGAFLYGPLHRFSNDDLRCFFHNLGVHTVVERGGRVFPQSQKAADLVLALERFLRESGVRVALGERASAIVVQDGRVTAVAGGGRTYKADKVVLATGGASYPATGSTGDGFKMAAEVGHTIVPLRPALVPLETEETWVRAATGLALRNAGVILTVDGGRLAEDFGEMLFTHYGVSGPVILTMSGIAAEALKSGKKPKLHINLKPALSREQLDARLLRDFEKYSRKQFKNSLGDLLPAKLIEPVIDMCRIDGELPVHQISREKRRVLAEVITGLTLTVKSTRPLSEAIVTAGGVETREIDPKTLASRVVGGLHFAGEVIDVAGNTGGYNLQSAFSTGYLAGLSSAKKE